MSIAPLSFPGEFRPHSLTLLFHCLHPDIGEFDPVPHAHFPRGSYGSCGSPLDLQKTGRLAGLFEVVERDFESDVYDVVEFTRRPRMNTKLRTFRKSERKLGRCVPRASLCFAFPVSKCGPAKRDRQDGAEDDGNNLLDGRTSLRFENTRSTRNTFH